MTEIDNDRQRWLAERESYEHLARVIETIMATAVRNSGVWCSTESRAKETHSIVKKLLKGKHTYESMPDKAGARCVVRYVSDLEHVVGIAQSELNCRAIDRKASGLGAEKLGYVSIHIDVGLNATHPAHATFGAMRAELQIRTLAQHLWSEISHDAMYKNEDTLAQIGVPRI